MSNTVIGYGATVSIKIGSATAVVLGEVISIGLPNPQVSDVEATHFTSPSRTREYIAGLIENGEIPIGINYDAGSATDAQIVAAMAAAGTVEVVITVPTFVGVAQKFTFPGIVKGYEKTIPLDDRQTAVVTVRVAGAVVQTAAS